MSDDDTFAPQPVTALRPWQRGGPTPNPAGRGKGVANRFSKQLVEDFADHWRTQGRAAIEKVYDENPGLYLKIATSLVPKELLIEVSRPLENLSDAELQEAAEAEAAQQAKLIEHIKEKVGSHIIDEAAREVMGEEDEDAGD